jgi:oxaloacetate decarboxylase gamma subunit
VGILIQTTDSIPITPFRLTNITDGHAIGISITGMLIVFAALGLISAFIAALPKVLATVEPYWPTSESHHHAPRPAEILPIDEERIVAAIGTVLRHETQGHSKQ